VFHQYIYIIFHENISFPLITFKSSLLDIKLGMYMHILDNNDFYLDIRY